MILPYTKYNKEQISKIGNSIIYLADKIDHLSKTKLLKLLYILDEISIKRSGIPFFNLRYKLWKLGPVAPELYVEFSQAPELLKNFFFRTITPKGHTYIKPKADFVDDEFTNNDIKLLDFVIRKFGTASAEELVSYTHRPNSPWYNTARNNAVLDVLENAEIKTTDYNIDLSQLVEHDERKKNIYADYLNNH